jgi:hypothetical protein
VGDGVLAEAAADVVTLVEWRHGEEIDLAVSRFGVDSPGDEADDRALSEGGYGCVTAHVGRVGRDLVAVVLLPVSVLMLVDLLAEVGTGVPSKKALKVSVSRSMVARWSSTSSGRRTSPFSGSGSSGPTLSSAAPGR